MCGITGVISDAGLSRGGCEFYDEVLPLLSAKLTLLSSGCNQIGWAARARARARGEKEKKRSRCAANGILIKGSDAAAVQIEAVYRVVGSRSKERTKNKDPK